MHDPSAHERDRLTEAYADYDQDGSVQRWDPTRPGNVCILAERDDRVRQLLGRHDPPMRTLEVGCGRGDVLATLPIGPGHRLGVDLLARRLVDARRRQDPLAVTQADIADLPLATASVDLIVAFTVFSSVISDATRQAMADEITRVARPGATLLWYDMRRRNPANRAVRPVGHRDLEALFPRWVVDVAPITLLPPLARRLGRGTNRWYPRLARIGLLRTHLVGTLSLIAR